MNKKLKFSWAHIIAFVAIIFFAYITFVGSTYLFKCNFLISGIVTFAIVAVLFFLFIGVQQIKGTDEKFAKSIVWERILLAFTIIVFCASLHPFLHTWHVQKNHTAIENHFSTSITKAKQLFVEYEKYSENRINNYSSMMDEIIQSRNIVEKSTKGKNDKPVQTAKGLSEYERFGFVKNYEQKQKELRLQTLRLQLLSSNYDQLKEKAGRWIESADRKASIWNIFLVGNIGQIKSAVKGWESQLQSNTFSGKILADEEFDGKNKVSKFDVDSKYLDGTIKGLDDLRGQFTSTGAPSLWGYIIAVICYIALIFPYFIQPRSTRNWYRLFGYAKWYKSENIVRNGIDNKEESINVGENSNIKNKRKTRNKNAEDDGQIHIEGIENI